MWKKLLAIIFLFYLFALLQNSFFSHFNLFGAVPNLVFILFFLLIFFTGKGKNYQIICIAATAGIFLDLFSYTYLGPSIVLLIIIGFLIKNAQSLLKNREDSHPFIYFVPLLIISLLAYDLFLSLYLYFLDQNKSAITFGLGTIFYVIYNLLIASILFYIYKKFLVSKRG